MSGVEKKRLSTEKASKIVIYKKQKNYSNLIQSKDFDTTIITINQQISPFTEPQKIFTLYVLPIYEMTRFQNHLLDSHINSDKPIIAEELSYNKENYAFNIISRLQPNFF